MSEPYLSSILIAGWGFVSRGYASCNGQLIPISQNRALYNLLGTDYGGDGTVNYALPDIRGRTPLHDIGSLGVKMGATSVVLHVSQMPEHTHNFIASSKKGNARNAAGAFLSRAPKPVVYTSDTSSMVSMNPMMMGVAGADAPHENCQPFITLNFLIATVGIFPMRN